MDYKEIALEAAKNLFFSVEDNEIVEFATRFLAAVDAERGKEAVAWMNDDEEWTSEYWRKVAGCLPFDDMYPLYLSPTIPENMVLMPVIPTAEILAAMQSSGWMPGNYQAMIQASPEGVTK